MQIKRAFNNLRCIHLGAIAARRGTAWRTKVALLLSIVVAATVVVVVVAPIN